MEEVRTIVSLALAERSAKGIKIRQPLASLRIKNKELRIKNHEELLSLIRDEVNVKEVIFDDTIKLEVELDTNITKTLKEEGLKREVTRVVNDLRKEGGFTPTVYVSHVLSTTSIMLDPQILQEVRVKECIIVIEEKEIPLQYTKKEIEITKGKKDFIAIPPYKIQKISKLK